MKRGRRKKKKELTQRKKEGHPPGCPSFKN
jgi:hypothetical protein